MAKSKILDAEVHVIIPECPECPKCRIKWWHIVIFAVSFAVGYYLSSIL